MDCPNCGAYNASNSFRCRRCNHVLPTGEDEPREVDSAPEEEWGPASAPGPEQRWDEQLRSDPAAQREPESAKPSESWRESEPTQPADWDIAQPTSSPGPTSQGPAYGGQAEYGAGGGVPNYLWPSIGATLCCCLPLGIPAIVYAARVDAFMKGGDRAAAEEASGKARNFALAAFGVALLFWIGMFCLGMFGSEPVT